MKSKEQRYREAIERNLRNLQINPHRAKYRDAPLALCRRLLGIRNDDSSFDAAIFKLRETVPEPRS